MTGIGKDYTYLPFISFSLQRPMTCNNLERAIKYGWGEAVCIIIRIN